MRKDKINRRGKKSSVCDVNGTCVNADTDLKLTAAAAAAKKNENKNSNYIYTNVPHTAVFYSTVITFIYLAGNHKIDMYSQ